MSFTLCLGAEIKKNPREVPVAIEIHDRRRTS